LLFLTNNELLELITSRMRKNTTNFDEVPFFVETTMINIIKTKISYSNVIPHVHIDGEEKFIHVYNKYNI
jgi:hypothetical protein